MSDAPLVPPPSGGNSHKDAKAQAKAAKAHAKAMRPWYKKKRFILPLILLVLVIAIAAASSGGSEDDPSPVAANGDDGESAETPEEPEAGGAGSLYPDRPDQQDEDQEAAIGESVKLSGYTATLTAASYSKEEFMETDLVTISVRIENRDDSAQPYNTFDWKIQTSNGQVLDPTILAENSLGSGDLVGGGSVEGDVGFEVGPGTYYVIYKPDPFDGARGIWQITVGT
jgi:hypothetical protein